jgi:hypothetical protein
MNIYLHNILTERILFEIFVSSLIRFNKIEIDQITNGSVAKLTCATEDKTLTISFIAYIFILLS